MSPDSLHKLILNGLLIQKYLPLFLAAESPVHKPRTTSNIEATALIVVHRCLSLTLDLRSCLLGVANGTCSRLREHATVQSAFRVDNHKIVYVSKLQYNAMSGKMSPTKKS